MRCTTVLDKSKCMYSWYIPGAFSMHWKGLEMRLARQLLRAHKKVVRHFFINSMCKRAMEVIVFSIFSVRCCSQLYVDNMMTIAALTIQGSISKLNLVCIAMLSSDPHSLSMHRGVEAMTIGTIATIPININ